MRPGVGQLPGPLRRTFAQRFMPVVIQEAIGYVDDPWASLDHMQVQWCVNRLYDGQGIHVKEGDVVHTQVRQHSP